MKIIKVQLENWCQYAGKHTLDFGDEAGNVVLIHADNDIGKSSLFYSIAWCLHRRQPEKWDKNNWPLYPIPWHNAAKTGEETKTQVSVKFPTNSGQRECGVNSHAKEYHRWPASGRHTRPSSSSRP